MNDQTQVTERRLVAGRAAGRTVGRALLLGALSVLCFFITARILMAPYAVKSIVKVILFLGVPCFCLRLDQHDIRQRLDRLFRIEKQEGPILLRILLIGSGIILVVCLLAEPVIAGFGLVDILSEIKARTHTDTLAFIGAMIYIPLVNALVEEWFFRDFLFLYVYENGYPRVAMLGSATLFALYHLAIFRNWFSWPILVMVLCALFLAGILLNRLMLRWRKIVMVWLLHGLVNLAILLLAWRVF